MTILAALGGAALGGFLSPIALDWWFKPKLRIARVDKLERRHLCKDFWRVIVENGGRRAAVSCLGRITLHGLTANDIWGGMLLGTAYPRIGDTGVCWAVPGNPADLTINPHGGTQPLDICAVPYNDVSFQPEGIEIPTETGWDQPRAKLALRSYDVTITVTAENASAASSRMDVVFDAAKVVARLREGE